MNCIDFEQQARDWIRTGDLPADAARHAAECPECAQLLERNRILSAALAGLARADASERPPAALEKKMVAEFRRRRSRPPIRLAWLAIAAAVLIAVIMAGFRSRRPEVAATPVPPGTEADLFYAIGPGAAIEPDGFAPVVRMRLPRRELRRIGLAAWGPAAGGETASLEVDVLVGRDGVAKAIRLVRNGERIRQ